MKTPIEKYNFELKDELIAQYPSDKRDHSNLLCVDRQTLKIQDKKFYEIIDLIDENSFLVVNNTKVLKARLYAKKETGGQIEILLTEQLSEKKFKAIVGGKWKKEGKVQIGNFFLKLSERDDEGLVIVDFEDHDPFEIMEKEGHIPLPPYIKRKDFEEDISRYNTVYSKNSGSIAAPTAGLHFTREIINKLQEKGVQIIEITLNVGIGTFKPVKTEYVEDHQMHSENYTITKEAAEKINDLKKKGKKLIAVGTTTVRALESSIDAEQLEIKPAYNKSTNLFITEGYKFKAVDHLITNFHLPKSTLLILVTAFGGYDLIMKAYKHAVQNKYRFFSYGDAMFIR